jgi:Clp amino terminal domain, pathogenicity island component
LPNGSSATTSLPTGVPSGPATSRPPAAAAPGRPASCRLFTTAEPGSPAAAPVRSGPGGMVIGARIKTGGLSQGIGRTGDAGEGWRRSMFERFTDRARRVVVRAQEAARNLDRDWVGTEHVLLGLIHEGNGVAAKVLESLGIGPDAVQQRVEDLVGRGERAPSGHIPFTPQAKDRHRAHLARPHQPGDGVAAQVLTELGVDLDEARERVIRLLDEYRRKGEHRTG